MATSLTIAALSIMVFGSRVTIGQLAQAEQVSAPTMTVLARLEICRGTRSAVSSPDTKSVAKPASRGNSPLIDVVPNLRRLFPSMATCATGACRTAPAAARPVRVLRWTFRRQDEAVVCELGLTGDESAYELRVDAAWNRSGATTELFDDAMSAFERHAALERTLVEGGWMLEGFESEQVLRTA